MDGRRLGLILMALGALSALGALLYEGGRRAEGRLEAPSDAEALVDPKGFELRLPGGWRVTRRAQGEAHIRADLVDGRGGGVQVRWRPLTGAFDPLAEALVASYQQDMERHWGAALEEISRSGQPGASLRVTWVSERRGGAWILEERLVALGPHLLILQGGSPWRQREAWQAGVEALAESLRLTGR